MRGWYSACNHSCASCPRDSAPPCRSSRPVRRRRRLRPSLRPDEPATRPAHHARGHSRCGALPVRRSTARGAAAATHRRSRLQDRHRLAGQPQPHRRRQIRAARDVRTPGRDPGVGRSACRRTPGRVQHRRTCRSRCSTSPSTRDRRHFSTVRLSCRSSISSSPVTPRSRTWPALSAGPPGSPSSTCPTALAARAGRYSVVPGYAALPPVPARRLGRGVHCHRRGAGAPRGASRLPGPITPGRTRSVPAAAAGDTNTAAEC